MHLRVEELAVGPRGAILSRGPAARGGREPSICPLTAGGGAPRQPLSPVIEIPSMNVRCVKKKSPITGSATSVLAAIR